MSSFLEALLNTLWQGAVLALLMWAAMRLLPRINAATRCAVWWVVLAIILLLPLSWSEMRRSERRHASSAAFTAPAPEAFFAAPRFERAVPIARPGGAVQIRPGTW